MNVREHWHRTRTRIISRLMKIISGLNDLLPLKEAPCSPLVHSSERLREATNQTYTLSQTLTHIHWSNIPQANLWWKPELNENRGTQAPSPLIRSPSTTCTAHQKDNTLWSEGAPSFIHQLRRPKHYFFCSGPQSTNKKFLILFNIKIPTGGQYGTWKQKSVSSKHP